MDPRRGPSDTNAWLYEKVLPMANPTARRVGVGNEWAEMLEKKDSASADLVYQLPELSIGHHHADRGRLRLVAYRMAFLHSDPTATERETAGTVSLVRSIFLHEYLFSQSPPPYQRGYTTTAGPVGWIEDLFDISIGLSNHIRTLT